MTTLFGCCFTMNRRHIIISVLNKVADSLVCLNANKITTQIFLITNIMVGARLYLMIDYHYQESATVNKRPVIYVAESLSMYVQLLNVATHP